MNCPQMTADIKKKLGARWGVNNSHFVFPSLSTF